MPEQAPLDVVRAFIEAWTRNDLDTAATYLADGIKFDGPIQHFTSAAGYLPELGKFAATVTSGPRWIAAFGDAEQALVMYEVTTGPLGLVPSAERFTVKDGKITSERLVFDATAVHRLAASA